MEPYIYRIKKIKLNEYEIFNWDESILARLLIQNDTLHFTLDDIHSKFIKSETTKQYAIDHYYRDNVHLLNKAFVLRGYPTLDQIVNHNYDSLRCDCNPWKGNVNLLYVERTSLAWLIRISNDSLFLETVINNKYADPDDPLETEKLVSFKWFY